MRQEGTGRWVQVYKVLLKPGERAPGIPAETAAVPLTMKVKGFLEKEGAAVGDTVTIRTVTGRLVEGELAAVNPEYPVSYGQPQPELLRIGPGLRRMLRGEEKP